MDGDARRLMRAVVRRVHPDLFAAHPFERQRNSESLKALNGYVDALALAAGARRRAARGGGGGTGADDDLASLSAPPPRAATVEFWVRSTPSSLPGSAQSSFQEEEEGGAAAPPPPPPPQEQQLTRVVAALPASGSLAPLFFAFGLITDAEMRAGAGGLFGGGAAAADTDFLQWLRETVAGAVSAAERHETLKRRIREARASLEHRHGLASLRAGAGDYAAGPAEQRRQLGALRALGAAMAALAPADEEEAVGAGGGGGGDGGGGGSGEGGQTMTAATTADGGMFAGLSVHVHYVASPLDARRGKDGEDEEEQRANEEEDEDEENHSGSNGNGNGARRRNSEARAALDEQEREHDDDDDDDLDDDPSTRSYIADDGCLHLFARGRGARARRASLRLALSALDLPRARALAQASMFWLRRVRELAPVVRSLLCVENVWCDTRTEQNAQNFVLWAGYLLEQREAAGDALSAALGGAAAGGNGAGNGNGENGIGGGAGGGHGNPDQSQAARFSFSLLVHSDPDSSPVDFSPASSILQVRSDCPPRELVAFLVSEAGAAADAAAQRAALERQEEHALLERVRLAFGAKHVVRVCAARDPGLVLDGARRLLEAAAAVREAGVDLRGASLALDDCYEVWGSGFISIPYDFTLQELRPQLARLLQASQASQAAGGGGEGEGGEGAAAVFEEAAAAAASGGGGGGGGGVAAGAFSAAARPGRVGQQMVPVRPLPALGRAGGGGGRAGRIGSSAAARGAVGLRPQLARAKATATTAAAAAPTRSSRLMRLF